MKKKLIWKSFLFLGCGAEHGCRVLVLHCIRFALSFNKISCISTIQNQTSLFCIVFDLHYLCIIFRRYNTVDYEKIFITNGYAFVRYAYSGTNCA